MRPGAAGVYPGGFTRLLRCVLLLAAGAAVEGVEAGRLTVSLSSSPSGSAPAGTPVTWTASASGTGPFEYRFRTGTSPDALSIVRDFSGDGSFPRVSFDEETYFVAVEARTKGTATGARSEPSRFSVTPRTRDAVPIVTASPHPLVGFLSAPASACAGAGLRVDVRPAGVPGRWRPTPVRPCTGRELGFLVAGLRASSAWELRTVAVTADGERPGPSLSFATGPVPVPLPGTTVAAGPSAEASRADELLWLSVLPERGVGPLALAVDLEGETVWYDPDFDRENRTPTGVTRDGTVLLIVDAGGLSGQLLKEIDLAGNVLRETTVARVREQLPPLPADTWLGAFDHEAIRFPNGQTLVQCSLERLFRRGPGPADVENVLGAMVVALDAQWQVAWSWNSFDHLDVARGPTMAPEICQNTRGCPSLFLPKEVPPELRAATDWLHGNALAPSPDGNLTYSLRHQDWVLKIRYADGTGDGAVLWRLGKDGDFAVVGGDDPSPWFSHQHGAVFVDRTTLSLFDNGNVRCRGDPACPSRGQLWRIDEAERTATPLLSFPVGNSVALGASQRLTNGNAHFTSGLEPTAGTHFAESVEVTPDGSVALALRTSASVYRSYRMSSLYGSSLTGDRPSADAGRLVLSHGRVSVACRWKNRHDGTEGVAAALPRGNVFGGFRFTDPAVPEVVAKVLDFGPDRPLPLFWAGLTDLEYFVTFTRLDAGDSVTFRSPPGGGAGATSTAPRMSEASAGPATALPRGFASPPDRAESDELRLAGGQVAVTAEWRSPYTGETGHARAVRDGDPSGYFWFSGAANPELFVKVLDWGAERPFLLFAAGLTDFEATISFRNVRTGQVVVFRKPAGSADTLADGDTLLH